MNITWKRSTAKYSNAIDCYCGIIRVGHVFVPASRPRDSEPFYRAEILLPGVEMKKETIDHKTEEAAKERLEKAIATWFIWVNK